MFREAALLPFSGFLSSMAASPIFKPTPAVLRASRDGVAAWAASVRPKAAEKIAASSVRNREIQVAS